jgi:hypothetical protein
MLDCGMPGHNSIRGVHKSRAIECPAFCFHQQMGYIENEPGGEAFAQYFRMNAFSSSKYKIPSLPLYQRGIWCCLKHKT